MKKRSAVPYILALWLIIVSCNLPTVAPDSAEPVIVVITATNAPSLPADVASPTTSAPVIPPTFTSVPPTACTALVIASTLVNIRSGPGMVYDVVGNLPVGGTANVAGKSADGTWWYIDFAGGHAWVFGSVVTASCIPTTLAIIAAPPTPRPASGTCMPGYVFRLASPSDRVCVPPASQSQAEADNAAAASRKIVNIYGVDACITGYVWRGAYSGDIVCVTEGVRAQAAADNAVAASRWEVGPSGPHTCILGFVWRGARAGDDVCVTGDVRDQTAADNAAAASRKAVNVYGMDACIPGYIWRGAFAGDYVCVTPAVQSQVAADNAAAPSHTWP
jgi:hypothetical protein